MRSARCATGGQGGLRNLVLMGMGEPLHNYEHVMRALEIITDDRGLNLGPTRISISTVGVVPGILRLAAEGRPYNLAVSLHGASEAERAALVPASKRWPLAELIAACRTVRRAAPDGASSSSGPSSRGSTIRRRSPGGWRRCWQGWTRTSISSRSTRRWVSRARRQASDAADAFPARGAGRGFSRARSGNGVASTWRRGCGQLRAARASKGFAAVRYRLAQRNFADPGAEIFAALLRAGADDIWRDLRVNPRAQALAESELHAAVFTGMERQNRHASRPVRDSRAGVAKMFRAH